MEVRRQDGFRLEVALKIPAGKTVALLGPNGAGKSTAVAAIAGLLPLDGGRVTLGNVTLDDPAARVHVPPDERRIGVVFQDYLLFPHLNVVDNIAFGLRSRGIGREPARARANDWTRRLGLSGL